MRDISGVGDTAPFILNLVTRWAGWSFLPMEFQISWGQETFWTV